MAAKKRKLTRQFITPETREKIGSAMVNDGLSKEETAKLFNVGVSTAGACATVYRKEHPGSVKVKSPQKIKGKSGSGKSIRYDEAFKARAVKAVFKGGKKRVLLHVADELGISEAGLRKWVMIYEEELNKTEKPTSSPETSEPLSTDQEFEVIKNHAQKLQRQKDELELKNHKLEAMVAHLNNEVAMLKPLAARYLNI